MKIHCRLHSGEKPFACHHEDCCRRFTQRAHLAYHLRAHASGKTFVCPESGCHKRFAQNTHLINHLHRHTNPFHFVCHHKDCGRVFAIKNSLDAHLRAHSGDRPFPCRYPGCNKRFSQHVNLVAHHRVHSGEKPFACPYDNCGKHFRQQPHLKNHLRTHGTDSAASNRWHDQASRSLHPSRSARTKTARLKAGSDQQRRQNAQEHNRFSGLPDTRDSTLLALLTAPPRYKPGKKGRVTTPAHKPTIDNRSSLAHKLPRQPGPGDKPAMRREDRTPPVAIGAQEPPPDRTEPGLADFQGPVSPRLPSVPLSADCLHWLACQTIRATPTTQPLASGPDSHDTFCQWLMSPDPDSPSVNLVPDRQQPPGGHGVQPAPGCHS